MDTTKYERALEIRSEVMGLTDHLGQLPRTTTYSYDLETETLKRKPDEIILVDDEDEDEEDELPKKYTNKKKPSKFSKPIQKPDIAKKSSLYLRTGSSRDWDTIVFDEFLPEGSFQVFIEMYRLKVKMRIDALEKEFSAL